MRTIVGGKQQPSRVFVAIDVWSRLWPAMVVGRRSYRNTLGLFRDVSNRMDYARFPLIATGGFEFYEKVVRRVFGSAYLYSQVIKMRRNDRVVGMERRARIGAAWRWEQALSDSEDSEQLNTTFIERLKTDGDCFVLAGARSAESSASSGARLVAVMEAADSGELHQLSDLGALPLPRLRRVFAEAEAAPAGERQVEEPQESENRGEHCSSGCPERRPCRQPTADRKLLNLWGDDVLANDNPSC